MFYPTLLHISFWTVLAVLAALESILPAMTTGWDLLAATLLACCLLDVLFSLRRPQLTISRKVHTNLAVDNWSTIELHVASGQEESLHLQLHDYIPPAFNCRNSSQTLQLVPGGGMGFTYEVRPTQRGLFRFKGLDIFVRSPLRLWQKKWFFRVENETRVFPNFREISHYALLATHHNLSQMGIKKIMRRGEGKEFHQLRDYRKGDEMQRIDWKATSRHRRLISREYQDERDQQILFLVDSGRRMSHREKDRRHLDEALNSVLLLTYVATRQGDAVGLHSFGGTEKYLPPRKHGDSMRSMLLTMYDIETSQQTADFRKATEEVLKLQSRRALIVLVTNSRLEDYEDLLHLANQLKRKHLLVIANLRETLLDEEYNRPISSFGDAKRYQAIQDYLNQKDKLTTQLKHYGVIFLDVTAPQLPAALVNSYLDIKRSGIL